MLSVPNLIFNFFLFLSIVSFADKPLFIYLYMKKQKKPKMAGKLVRPKTKIDQVANQSNSVWVRKLNLVNLVKKLLYSGNLDLRKNIRHRRKLRACPFICVSDLSLRNDFFKKVWF